MQGSGAGLWRPGGGLWRRLQLSAVFAVLTAVMVACETSSTTTAPHVSALVPDCAVEGSDDLVVAVAGEHFQPGASVVLWNGSARPTQTFLGTTTLVAATIFRGDLLVPGPATVTVTIVESDVRRSSPPVTFDVVPASSAAGRDTAACHEAAAADAIDTVVLAQVCDLGSAVYPTTARESTHQVHQKVSTKWCPRAC